MLRLCTLIYVLNLPLYTPFIIFSIRKASTIAFVSIFSNPPRITTPPYAILAVTRFPVGFAFQDVLISKGVFTQNKSGKSLQVFLGFCTQLYLLSLSSRLGQFSKKINKQRCLRPIFAMDFQFLSK